MEGCYVLCKTSGMRTELTVLTVEDLTEDIEGVISANVLCVEHDHL